MTQPYLEMRGIQKRFGATAALKGVDFEVKGGEVHALVGENGAGKSTLMKILSGAHKPDAGRMRLAGKDFKPRDPLHARQQGIGMIYQELTLAPHLTVEENVLLGQEPKTWGFVHRRHVRQLTVSALERLGHSEISPEKKVHSLSISEQQLVEIARSLTAGCRVLVFDEPTSSLNQQDIQRLFSIISELKKQGLAIVYISHFLEEVKSIADRVTVLRDGEKVGTQLEDNISLDDIVRMMVGREVQDMYPHSSREAGEVLLEIRNLNGMKKPRSANLCVHRGEILGLAGLVGAGRTELLRTIFGLDPVTSGEIQVGVYAGSGSPLQRWKQSVGMLSENRKDEGLAVDLDLADNITMSSLNRFGPWGFLRPSQQHQAADIWIKHLDIRCQGPQQKVMDISGGNQQKIALGRLLQHGVDVLLLDEPTRGIDVAAKAKIYQIIDTLTSPDPDSGRPPKAILMTSSYLPELLGVCDRIAVMYRGVLGAARPVQEWTEEKLMQAATGQSEHKSTIKENNYG